MIYEDVYCKPWDCVVCSWYCQI